MGTTGSASARVVRHDLFGTLGLPLLARLHDRKVDIPKLPELAKIPFRTKLQQAAEMLKVIAGRAALRRAMWHQEYQQLGVPTLLDEKILPFFDRITRLAG